MNKALLVSAATALLAGCNQSPPAPDKTIQQLMADDVQTTAEVYWNSVQYISDLERGNYEILPETEEDWQQIRDAATRLGEFGELMKTPGYAAERGEDWIEISNSLVEVSKLAEQAADERSTDKVFEVGGTIYSVCTACHQVYPPAEGLPEAETAPRPGDDDYDAPGER